jgi:hypothetical protein
VVLLSLPPIVSHLFVEHDGCNTGIVNFKHRVDAEHAKLGLQGQSLFDFPMRIDWMRSNGSNVVGRAHGNAGSGGVGSGKKRFDQRYPLHQQNKFSSGYGYASDGSLASGGSNSSPAMWQHDGMQAYATMPGVAQSRMSNTISSPIMSVHVKFCAPVVSCRPLQTFLCSLVFSGNTSRRKCNISCFPAVRPHHHCLCQVLRVSTCKCPICNSISAFNSISHFLFLWNYYILRSTSISGDTPLYIMNCRLSADRPHSTLSMPWQTLCSTASDMWFN